MQLEERITVSLTSSDAKGFSDFLYPQSSSPGLVLQIKRIVTLSFLRSLCRSPAVGGGLCFASMQQCRAHACIECYTTSFQGQVLRCEDWQEFLDLSPNSTSGCNGKSASHSSTQHVAQVAEAGFNVNKSTIYIYIRDWSAIIGSNLATVSGLTSNLLRTSLYFLCTHKCILSTGWNFL